MKRLPALLTKQGIVILAEELRLTSAQATREFGVGEVAVDFDSDFGLDLVD